jgi:hypothetical protein
MTNSKNIAFLPSAAAPVTNATPVHQLSVAVDPLKLVNAQLHAERLQAHYDFLTTRQRESGMRIRLCSTGCYSIYDASGHFIGRTTTPDTWSGVAASQLKTVAARMAFSEELANVCRLADMDFERTGTVAPGTIVAMRTLLGAIGAT